MTNKLYIDIETYSSVSLKNEGVYNYAASIDFEILLICYALNDEPVQTIDLAQNDFIPKTFTDLLFDSSIEKHAHNANFERICFNAIGLHVPIDNWHCTAVKSAYCGLPLSLDGVSKALNLGEKGKLSTGKALIRYFCLPCKPTKTNGQRHRNFPHHDIQKWSDFIEYCGNDVEAERRIDNILSRYEIPTSEREIYILDQEINDRGVLADVHFAKKACALDDLSKNRMLQELTQITGLPNPNSVAQLKQWLKESIGKEIKSLSKDTIPKLIEEARSDTVKRVLELRAKSNKTSIKKYQAILNSHGDDNRIRGLFQFYGANRTGRWAGRLVQLQNLKRNYLSNLAETKEIFAKANHEAIFSQFDNVPDVLSQLIRTAFIAKESHTFAVADFSAIEARVLAWLANEHWRLDVFCDHGKIYEASASMMFNVPIETIGKGSELRSKGKVAELALGYQGSVGALTQMGASDMGLDQDEMLDIVRKWRFANPNIVKFWYNVELYAKEALRRRKRFILSKNRNLGFEYDGNVLTIQLPSGRKLFYQSPEFTENQFGQEAIRYKNRDQTTGKWGWVDSYGGKFVENITQAVARDLLADSMLRLDKAGFKITMHIHDESVCEVPIVGADQSLDKMCQIMGENVSWAKGLPLVADGYLTPFYKKD